LIFILIEMVFDGLYLRELELIFVICFIRI